MDKEKILELLEIIDLEKRVQEGAVSSMKASHERMNQALEQLDELLNQ